MTKHQRRSASPLKGRVIVLTGASGGLGADLARALVEHGARVALLARRTEVIAQLSEELSLAAGVKSTDAPNGGSTGMRALALRADVQDLTSLEKAMTRVAATFGRIDAVVAGAGTDAAGTVAQVAPSDFERDVDINLTGVWRTFRAALPHVMRTRGYLLAVSSLAAFIHSPRQASYTASKAGVWALCDSLRLELAGSGVGVGSIHPTFFDTPMLRSLQADPATSAQWSGNSGIFAPVPRHIVVEAAVSAIERRRRTVVVPHRYQAAALAPGLLQRVLERTVLRPSGQRGAAEPVSRSWKPAP